MQSVTVRSQQLLPLGGVAHAVVTFEMAALDYAGCRSEAAERLLAALLGDPAVKDLPELAAGQHLEREAARLAEALDLLQAQADEATAQRPADLGRILIRIDTELAEIAERQADIRRQQAALAASRGEIGARLDQALSQAGRAARNRVAEALTAEAGAAWADLAAAAGPLLVRALAADERLRATDSTLLGEVIGRARIELLALEPAPAETGSTSTADAEDLGDDDQLAAAVPEPVAAASRRGRK